MLKRWQVASLLAFSLTLGSAGMASAAQDEAGAALHNEEITVEEGMLVAPATDAVDNDKQTQAAPEPEEAAQIMDLSIEEALELARENNTGIKQAELQRSLSRVAAEQASSQRRSAPESDPYTGSFTKDQARLDETITNAAFEVADRNYDVVKEAIELEIKNNYYDVLKTKDLMAVSQVALERSQEQLRHAQVSFEVGTVAKNDVLGAEAMVSSAQAKLTAAENSFALAEINLSRSLGLPTATQYNLTSIVQYQPMPEVDLAATIADAQEVRVDILKIEADLEEAEARYELSKSYGGRGTYNTQQARLVKELAEISLADTQEAVVADLTGAYLNVRAALGQLDTYTTAVDQSKEGLRLAKLRYEVGMGTSLEVLTAAANLEEMEANRVGALYDHNLAMLSFETAQLAPIGR